MTATLGVGALAAWLALPLLARLAARSADEPASRGRLLAGALAGATLLLAIPWVRLATDGATAILVSAPAVTRAHALLDGWRPIAVAGALWLALVALGVLRTAAAALRVAGLCRRAEPSPALVARAAPLAAELGIATPRVLVSDETAIPFVTGLHAPRVVVPRALLDTLADDAVDLMLRHELLHVARGDLGRALAVAILRIPFTGHPTGRWLAAEIRIAREASIDAVVASAGAHAYATLLVDVAALAAGRDTPPALVGMDASALSRRLDWIIDPRPGRRGRGLGLLAGIVLAVTALLIAPRAAVALPPVPASADFLDECPLVEPACADHLVVECQELCDD